jgi:lipopolysaccharide transport protein LptA
MKYFWPVLAAAGCATVLCAQTNLVSPSIAATNEPATVRPISEILIQSDNAEFRFKTNVLVYRGNVRVTDDPQMRMTCDVLTLEAPKLPVGKFNRATAEGNVVIDFLDDHSQPNHATSDKTVYTYSITNFVMNSVTNWMTNAIVELTGNPVVTNAQGSIQGEAIVWDRLRGTVKLRQARTTIQPNATNSADFFGVPGQSKTNAPKVQSPATQK